MQLKLPGKLTQISGEVFDSKIILNEMWYLYRGETVPLQTLVNIHGLCSRWCSLSVHAQVDAHSKCLYNLTDILNIAQFLIIASLKSACILSFLACMNHLVIMCFRSCFVRKVGGGWKGIQSSLVTHQLLTWSGYKCIAQYVSFFLKLVPWTAIMDILHVHEYIVYSMCSNKFILLL